MSNEVVHFEIIGTEPAALRRYYAELFGWRTDDADAATEVSDRGAYGFVSGAGVAGGIGGGPSFTPHTVVYVAVDDVEAALSHAERLGGTRVFGPSRNPDGSVEVGQFRDPEGNLVGVAHPL